MTSTAPASANARATNSYDFVRFCAASCVFFSHHFDLAGFAEPKVPGTGWDFGELGVQIFFCLSGFLICLSLQRSRDWVRFIAARFFRIYPNLLLVLLVTSLVTLIWYRNGGNIGAHVSYVIDNLLMFVMGVTRRIPGVFEATYRHSVNTPLWTLPYELWLYVLLAVMFWIGRARAGLVVIVGGALIGLVWSVSDKVGDRTIGPFEVFEFVRLGSYFLSGAVLAVLWPWLKPHALRIGLAGLCGVVLVSNVMPFDTPILSLSLAAAVIGLGSSHAVAWFAKGGDASYGMYVFAWPIQQFTLFLVGSFWPSMLVAFAATVAAGYATWHGFEKRAMAYPDRISRYVKRMY